MKWYHVYLSVLGALVTFAALCAGLVWWWLNTPMGDHIDYGLATLTNDYRVYWAVLFGIAGAVFAGLLAWIALELRKIAARGNAKIAESSERTAKANETTATKRKEEGG